MDLDIGRIFAEHQRLRRATSPLSVQELLWMLGDLTGAVVPTDRDVFLEFEAPQPPAAPQPAAPPDTDVYLADLTIDGDTVGVGSPVNISRNSGYDNQPSFTRDGAAILFTSARGGTQTDVYRYEVGSGTVTQVTSTPESEYSPTETADGAISAVRVEADGTQRLWRFDRDGGGARVLLENVKPVGYHAWADDHTVALYILGPPGTRQPSTLHVADVRSGAVRQVATDVGRSLQRIPGGSTVSFVQREPSRDKPTFLIKELDPASGSTHVLVPAVDGPGDVDFAWTPTGTLLMAKGDRLYAWRRSQSIGTSMGTWTEVASLERLGLHGVTRLAVSPDGRRLALVANAN
jgi:hypothetical protein